MFGVTGASTEAEMIVLQYPVASVHCPKGNRLSGLPRYNMKCSRENVILRGIFYLVSCFPLHFMLYHGNLEYFSDSVGSSFHGLFCVSVSERIEVVCRQEQYSIPIVVLFQF